MSGGGPLWSDVDLAAHLGVSREVARDVLRDADRESGGRLLLREVGRWSFLVGALARLRPGLVRVESGARVAKRLDAIEVNIGRGVKLSTSEVAAVVAVTRTRGRDA